MALWTGARWAVWRGRCVTTVVVSDCVELMGVDPFGSSWWGSSWSATRGLVGKPLVRWPGLRSDSYDKYMSWTRLLTYTMELQDESAPFVDLLVSLARNAPSIEVGVG